MLGLQIQNNAELTPHVLLVDDEIFNLEILEEYLDDAGYVTEKAENGREACAILEAYPEKFHAVLLDRMMPEMGGIEVAHFMKQHDKLKHIPIIMQTAKATQQDIEEGLNAGILYYLTKPFEKDNLLGIVDIAVHYYFNTQELCKNLEKDISDLSVSGSFEFHNLGECREIASLLANLCADPSKVVVGLTELFTNAIEHGNLGIGYDQKTKLLAESGWLREVEHRLGMTEHRDKKVQVNYRIEEDEVEFAIKDQGAGFDYSEFLEISPRRSLNMHGRGIAIARNLSFDNMVYVDPGNEVIVKSRARLAG